MLTHCSATTTSNMSTKKHFHPRITRQTLLSFPSIDIESSKSCNTSSMTASPPRPAPDIPNEVWQQILAPLGTLALKTFRLVCREWAVIGAEPLYSTVYLNTFSTSWTGLLAIAASHHAASVKKIVWNPLKLPSRFLDREAWMSGYQNLLSGL